MADRLVQARRGPRGEVVLEACEAVELLNGLGVNQRVALTLRAAGFSYREIAAITGKTYTWTNRHLSEGRARVRALAASGTGQL